MTDERVRKENGTYVETVSPESVLDVFQQQNKPFVTTGDVADALDCSRQTARRKLSQLDDENGDGTIRREKISGSAVVWWLPD